jgi:hypothetical protein
MVSSTSQFHSSFYFATCGTLTANSRHETPRNLCRLQDTNRIIHKGNSNFDRKTRRDNICQASKNSKLRSFNDTSSLLSD